MPLRLVLGFGWRLRLVLGLWAIFLGGNCPRTTKFIYQHWWKWSQIYYSIINSLGHEQICLIRLVEIFVDDVYLSINTENRAENILRYLKFKVILGDARTQKTRDRVPEKESLQRRSLDITFFYAFSTIFFQEHYPWVSICPSAYLSFTHKSINIVLIF